MDVLVKSASIGKASVEIDLGGNHGKLIIRVSHQTDRFRSIVVHQRKTVGKTELLYKANLDGRTGEQIDAPAMAEAIRTFGRSG